MFKIPESYYASNILAIDPGTSHIGFAIFKINYRDRKIEHIHPFTIEASGLPYVFGIEEDIYSDRHIRLLKISAELENILMNSRPSVIVCEGPFFNRFRPVAYAALVETVHTIRNTVYRWDSNIQLEIVEPMLVKKTVRSSLTSKKEDVTTALKNIEGLQELVEQPLEFYDEHSIDAIAVGYTYLTLNGIIGDVC